VNPLLPYVAVDKKNSTMNESGEHELARFENENELEVPRVLNCSDLLLAGYNHTLLVVVKTITKFNNSFAKAVVPGGEKAELASLFH
jgi:hypothetical protein